MRHDPDLARAPYPDGAAELADHLILLNRRLSEAVARFRAQRPAGQRNGLDGVAIFDDEVDRFLGTSPDRLVTDSINADARPRCVGPLAARADASAALGIELPLDLLRRRFGLSEL